MTKKKKNQSVFSQIITNKLIHLCDIVKMTTEHQECLLCGSHKSLIWSPQMALQDKLQGDQSCGDSMLDLQLWHSSFYCPARVYSCCLCCSTISLELRADVLCGWCSEASEAQNHIKPRVHYGSYFFQFLIGVKEKMCMQHFLSRLLCHEHYSDLYPVTG